MNSYGQVGDSSSYNNRNGPVDTGLTGVVSVDLGYAHSCAVLNSTAVKCWGAGFNGRLGNNNMIIPAVLAPGNDVFGLSSGVATVTLGYGHTCARLLSGRAMCWGMNAYGQLGNGNILDQAVPGNVTGLSIGVLAIAAGNYSTCALLSTGAVLCWGQNTYGQIGDGTYASRFAPTPVLNLASGVSAIAGGGNHMCALLSTGAVLCWGYNGNGQLGDGTFSNRLVPTAVSGLSSGASSIAAGGNHTCARLSSGAVKCWGSNGWGQLGNGNTVDSSVPATVANLPLVATVTCGFGHTCAVTAGGFLYCWGYNRYGSVGDSTALSRITAVSIQPYALPSPPPAPPALVGAIPWVLPLAAVTPGAINPAITQSNMGSTVCATFWGTGTWTTALVRPATAYTTSIKVAQLAGSYSMFSSTWGSYTGNYEEDHLISLILGGHPTDPANLWPQPRDSVTLSNNAETKDLLEVKLHTLVCNNQTTLAEAQTAIASNWTAAYLRYMGMSTSPALPSANSDTTS